MKKSTIVAAMLVVTLGSLAAVAARKSLASAIVGPIDGSHVKGEFSFLDGGPDNGIVISGTARGLSPNETYVSLVYNRGSVSTGPTACTPTNSLISQQQMFVGFWKVDLNGNGSLFVNKIGESFVSLADVGTASIRRVDGPAPGGFVLQACGDIEEVRGAPRILNVKLKR